MALRSVAIALFIGATLLTSGCSLEPPHPAAPEQRGAAHSTHRAVVIAESMLGKPYRYGGNTPQGFDCSGLVYYAYTRAGYPISRDSDSQYAQTRPVDPRELRAGDLLFFSIDSNNDHVAIYVGQHRFIHAPSRGKRVSYASLNDDYWRQRFMRAGRLP